MENITNVLDDLVSFFVILRYQDCTNRTFLVCPETRMGPTYLPSVVVESREWTIESQHQYTEKLNLEVESEVKVTDVLHDLVPFYVPLQCQDCTNNTLLFATGTLVLPTYLPSCKATT